MFERFMKNYGWQEVIYNASRDAGSIHWQVYTGAKLIFAGTFYHAVPL